MYGVSAAYIAAMNSAIQRHRYKGTIDGVPFDYDDVLQGSTKLTDQCSDSSDMTVGAVYVGTLKLTLISDLGFTRGTWRGREISLTFEQLIDESNDTWESVPVGVFTVSAASHSESGIELTCYTSMSKLDEPYENVETNGTIYDLMTFICKKCGVDYGLTRTETEALPNGKEQFALYPDNGCSTWRDVVHYVAQLMGGFATSDRSGKIVLRKFGNQSHFTVDTSRRMTGSKFSDFKTSYTALTYDDLATKETVRKELSKSGLTVELGGNPFLCYGLDETKTRILNTILYEINAVKYVPFNSTMVGNPAFDLGDIITYTGGTAGTSSTCCLMSYNWNFGKSYQVYGYGKNPNLMNAESKEEKSANSGISSSKADTMLFFTYENATALNIGSDEKQICTLTAANIKETFVDFWIEIKMNVSVTDQQAVVNFRYALDDIDEAYKPIMTFNHSGTYTSSLHFYWKLSEVMLHTFKVWAEVDGGSIDIEVGDIHALLKGQGMSEENTWDGNINVSDEFDFKLRGLMNVGGFRGEVANIEFITPFVKEFTDNLSLDLKGNMTIGFSDDVSMTLDGNSYGIITENGFNLVTEDGKQIITE